MVFNFFKPNEDDVKIATLEARLTAMQSTNSTANIASIFELGGNFSRLREF